MQRRDRSDSYQERELVTWLREGRAMEEASGWLIMPHLDGNPERQGQCGEKVCREALKGLGPSGTPGRG